MTPTQTNQALHVAEPGGGRRRVRRGRKAGRERGRPRQPASERKRWKAEGERLQTALSLLRYKSQAAAAVHAGIKQATLNGIINGTRGVGVEHLRALAKIGIPADYIFGIAKELIPPGETRTIAKLADDLAAHLKLLGLTPKEIPEDWIREALTASVDGQTLLSRLSKSVTEELRAVAESFRTLSDQGVVYRQIKSADLRSRLLATFKGKWLPPLQYLKLPNESIRKLALEVVKQAPKKPDAG